MALSTTARITALSPAQSPPLVSTPMRFDPANMVPYLFLSDAPRVGAVIVPFRFALASPNYGALATGVADRWWG